MFSARLATRAFRERKEDNITPLRLVSSPLPSFAVNPDTDLLTRRPTYPQHTRGPLLKGALQAFDTGFQQPEKLLGRRLRWQ